jgi:hypothetical protein
MVTLSIFYLLFQNSEIVKIKTTDIVTYNLFGADYNNNTNLGLISKVKRESRITIKKTGEATTVAMGYGGQTINKTVLNIHQGKNKHGIETHYVLEKGEKGFAIELIYDHHCFKLVDYKQQIVHQFTNPQVYNTASNTWKPYKIKN